MYPLYDNIMPIFSIPIDLSKYFSIISLIFFLDFYILEIRILCYNIENRLFSLVMEDHIKLG